ncbi:Uncharacterised protein [uncultured archaeon]|nr:Uncharacterised protein [uncultured archaeon]
MEKMFTVEKRFPYSAKTPVGEYGWTCGSTENMPLFKALPWAVSQGIPLHELDGAILIRAGLHEAQKRDPSVSLDGSNLYQIVNTLSVARRSKNGWTISYCKLPNSEESVNLAEEGYNLNRNDKQLILPLENAVVREMIDEAQARGRVAPALDSSPLKLDLQSDYECNPHMIAAFGGKKHGKNVAAVNATYLKDRNCDYGYLWQLTIADLDKILPKDDSRAETHALIRRVGLGGVSCSGIISVGVVAGNYFSDGGRARGGTVVAREISSGNKGRLVRSAK